MINQLLVCQPDLKLVVLLLLELDSFNKINNVVKQKTKCRMFHSELVYQIQEHMRIKFYTKIGGDLILIKISQKPKLRKLKKVLFFAPLKTEIKVPKKTKDQIIIVRFKQLRK